MLPFRGYTPFFSRLFETLSEVLEDQLSHEYSVTALSNKPDHLMYHVLDRFLDEGLRAEANFADCYTSEHISTTKRAF
ncbi:hypothetical protein ACLOJK_010199 [Asimina triloba]